METEYGSKEEKAIEDYSTQLRDQIKKLDNMISETQRATNAIKITDDRPVRISKRKNGYQYYLEKKDNPSFTQSSGQAVSSRGDGSAPASVSEGKLDYQKQKQEQAKKRKQEADLKKTMERIDQIDQRLAEINDLFTQEEVFSDPHRLMELNQEKQALEEEEEQLMEKWEELESQTES